MVAVLLLLSSPPRPQHIDVPADVPLMCPLWPQMSHAPLRTVCVLRTWCTCTTSTSIAYAVRPPMHCASASQVGPAFDLASAPAAHTEVIVHAQGSCGKVRRRIKLKIKGHQRMPSVCDAVCPGGAAH